MSIDACELFPDPRDVRRSNGILGTSGGNGNTNNASPSSGGGRRMMAARV